jgi:hypothetical protein
MGLCISKYMCRAVCCGLKILGILLIFEFVYFYTIKPVTTHLRNCVLTLMTQSRRWNQLLYSCALLSKSDIITFSNHTSKFNGPVCKLGIEMGAKLTMLFTFCILIALNTCVVDLQSAIRKYSFVYISVTLFIAILCLEMAYVKQRTFISEMSSYTLFGKITLLWDWGICNSSLKVLM